MIAGLGLAQRLAADPPPPDAPALGHSQAVTLKIGNDKLVVQIRSPRIIQVDYLRGGKSDWPTPMVDTPHHWRGDPASTISGNSDPVVLKTALLEVRLSQKPCRLTLLIAAGTAPFGSRTRAGSSSRTRSCLGPTAECDSATRPASDSTASRPTRSTITTPRSRPGSRGPTRCLETARASRTAPTRRTPRGKAAPAPRLSGRRPATACWSIPTTAISASPTTPWNSATAIRRTRSTTAGITIGPTACSIISSWARPRRSWARRWRSRAGLPCFPLGDGLHQ